MYQGEFDSARNQKHQKLHSFRLAWMARMAQGMVKGLGDLGLVTL